MTKFEEEFKALTSWDWINVDLIQKILTKFGNWHSDEEFKAEIKKLTDQLITRNDELISSNYEIESLKSQLISREKQVIELKEADKAQGKEIIQLKSQLQQQALPVVPECVADAIAWDEQIDNSIAETLKNVFTFGDRGLKEAGLWIKNNPEKYIIARNIGYTVEKPQLFYIELPNVYGLKNKVLVSKVENGTIAEFSNRKNYALKFTEQEIKSIDERYWQFAVPVEDGE